MSEDKTDKQRVSELEAKLFNLEVRTALEASARTYGVQQDLMPLAVNDWVRQFGRDESGDFRPMNPDGTVRMGSDQTPMSVDEFVQEALAATPALRAPSTGSQSNSGGMTSYAQTPGINTATTRKTYPPRSRMSDAERGEFIRTHGEEAYFNLQA